jgi:hypothetical protein
MQSDQYPGFSAATVMPEGSAELPADGTTTSSLNSLFMPRNFSFYFWRYSIILYSD